MACESRHSLRCSAFLLFKFEASIKALKRLAGCHNQLGYFDFQKATSGDKRMGKLFSTESGAADSNAPYNMGTRPANRAGVHQENRFATSNDPASLSS